MREPTRFPTRFSLVLAGLACVLLLSACAAGSNPQAAPGPEQAGFLLGLWHGIILPVTFVISLFTDTVSVYEVANRGNWYDFGFFLGVMFALGGAGRAGRRH